MWHRGRGACGAGGRPGCRLCGICLGPGCPSTTSAGVTQAQATGTSQARAHSVLRYHYQSLSPTCSRLFSYTEIKSEAWVTLSVVSAGGKVEPPEGSGPWAHNLSQEYTPGRRACPWAHALRCYRHQAWPRYPAVLGEAKERLVHWASRQGFYLDSKQTKAERRGDHELICPLMSWEPQVSGSSQWGNRQGRMQAP